MLRFILSILLLSIPYATSRLIFHEFLNCLPKYSNSYYPISKALYTHQNSSFSSVLDSHNKNKRFLSQQTPKPLAIITALHRSHVRATIICAKLSGLQIRIRSGGHDYEGLSYVSNIPFVVLDLFNIRNIDINIIDETAWVDAGATIGELYYKISNTSKVHAFPAAVCPTVGTGGYFSGGGYGNLMRKYGLSVDNIIDAKIVDVHGNLLDRKSMGEDLFWAIRGGGGASFGVILSWKIKLVPVPENVTVFNVKRTVEQGAVDLLTIWQDVAPNLDKNLFIRVMHNVVNKSDDVSKKTVQASFIGQFLGNITTLIPLINQSFPQLGLQRNDCTELSWVDSTLFWYNFPNGTTKEALLNRPNQPNDYFKSKSDYVKKPISKQDLNSIYDRMIKLEKLAMQWNPYGGRMSEIPETATPFPHRAGNLFKIQYLVSWNEEGIEAANHYLNISRTFYESMTPYVSNSPRESFLNYRDLDIGSNPSNQTGFENAREYGSKYFKGNYERLVHVKTWFDPHNFFRHEQSIPSLKSDS